MLFVLCVVVDDDDDDDAVVMLSRFIFIVRDGDIIYVTEENSARGG